jgi:DNA-binding transcriptional LysR family regulator
MNLRQLEYLNALASERHFGRAAEATHVSQPALSASLKKLEQELGVTLVQRSQSFGALTPEGEILVEWARRIIGDVDSLRDEATRLKGELTGTIRLGVIPTAMPAAALITERLLQRNPGISLEIRSLPSAEIARQIATHDIDGGISYLDDEPLGSVKTMRLYDERYFLLTTKRKLGGRRSMSWAELEDEPLCLLTTDMQNRRIVDAALSRAGVSVSPRVQSNEISGLAAFARSGYSCVVAHPSLALDGLPTGMSAVELLDPDIAHPVGLVTATLDPPAPLVRVLRENLAQSHVALALDTATAQWPTSS